MLHEEQLEQVKKMKIQKDKERLEGQRKRIQQRLSLLGVDEADNVIKTHGAKDANLKKSSLNQNGEETQKLGRKVQITIDDEKEEETRCELELVVNE